ncbi:MAG: M23 family metallopeptidase [Chloroflexota bacterium]
MMKRLLFVLLWSVTVLSCSALPTPYDPPELIIEVENAIQAALNETSKKNPLFEIANTSILQTDISSDTQFAVSWLVPVDPETSEPVPIEPGLVLLEFIEDDWQVWLPWSEDWVEMLKKIPDEILSPDHKNTWYGRAVTFAVDTPTTPLDGYKLPWEAGITRKLTQSTCHDKYMPSGNAHYAFDFSTTGEQWDIYAAKDGQVWLWKDDVPTCNEFTCSDTQPLGNYIVLKDEKTNPVTYQLYMHLKQGSIPKSLKNQGTPVKQGQFIAVVDNTGQSWGSHLHFQVQVPLYGENFYWGKSVDILFDDVDINDGRPRVKNAWCADDAYCNLPGDICDTFRDTYTSQNDILTGHPFNIYLPFIER